MKFVLKETLVSKQLGKDIWFKQMTGIGPMTTTDINERAEFDTREEAINCPALRHSLSFYEIKEVGLPKPKGDNNA